MSDNSGSRSGAGGGKRLSRWLLVAHWRCTRRPLTFPCLSLLSLSLSRSSPPSLFRLLRIRSPYPRHLSPCLIFQFLLSLYLNPGSLSASRVYLLRFVLSRAHECAGIVYTRTEVRAPLHRRLLLPLYVSARLVSIPPASGCSLPTHRRRIPLRSSVPLSSRGVSSFSPDNSVAAVCCYDLHSSRNKTSATAPRSRRRRR